MVAEAPATNFAAQPLVTWRQCAEVAVVSEPPAVSPLACIVDEASVVDAPPVVEVASPLDVPAVVEVVVEPSDAMGKGGSGGRQANASAMRTEIPRNGRRLPRECAETSSPW